MNNYCRLAITIFAWSVSISGPAWAQTRGPVAARNYETPAPVSETSDSVGDANANERVDASPKKSRWPLNLGRRLFNKNQSPDSVADPFLSDVTKGAEEQKRLAVELSSQAGQGVKNVLQNAQGGIQNLATIPQAGGSYPWPNPVDSQTGTLSAAARGAANEVASGVQSTAQQVAGDAAESGSRIVDAVRAANARVVGRLGGPARQSPLVGAGREALADAQTARNADSSGAGNYAQNAVDRYMQRVTKEGTANGRVFNPLAAVQEEAGTAVANASSQVQATVQNGINAAQQAPQQFVQQFQQQTSAPTPYITGVQPAPSGIVQAGNLQAMATPPSYPSAESVPPTQAPPTFTGYPMSKSSAQVAVTGQSLPSVVQPRTEYVPNMEQAPTGTPSYVSSGVAAPSLPNAGGFSDPSGQAIPTSNSVAAHSQTVAQAGPDTASSFGERRYVGSASGTESGRAGRPSRASSFPLGEVQTASAVSAPAIQGAGLTAPGIAIPQTLSNQPTASNAAMTSMPVSNTLPPGMHGTTAMANAGTGQTGLGNPDESTRVLAIVGDQSILAGDVMSQIGQMLEPYKQEMSDEQYQQQADLLIQKMLPRLVENKLVYIDFLRTVPPDKLPELRAKVFDFFSEKQLPELQEALGVASPLEIDAKLREMGSSLAKQQQMFLEKFVGRESVRRNVDMTAEITHDELLEYFHANKDEFSFPTRAKWERLSVELSKFDSQDAAHNALAQLGNTVQNGEDFSEVAKRGSHGPRAGEGGQYDWTTEGSLRANLVSELVFSLPPGRLSNIVEADGALHIVRVIERQTAGVEKFAEVQEKISDKIKEERYAAGAKEYLDRLTKETYVWTVYESSAAGATPVQMASPPAASGSWQ